MGCVCVGVSRCLCEVMFLWALCVCVSLGVCVRLCFCGLCVCVGVFCVCVQRCHHLVTPNGKVHGDGARMGDGDGLGVRTPLCGGSVGPGRESASHDPGPHPQAS